MVITIAQICDALEATLSATVGVARGESYDELTEGIPDTPLLQVYPEEGFQDPEARGTERSSFGAGVRQSQLTFHADLYVRERMDLGEDMKQFVTLTDAIILKFEEQDTKPYFGLDGIQAFAWSWKRVVFRYGQEDLRYVGIRFIIILRVF